MKLKEWIVKKEIARVSLLVTALLGATSAYAGSQNLGVDAEFVVPITVTKTQDLNFGAIAADGAGTVVIDTAGARSKTGDVILVTSAGRTPAQAIFRVVGLADATYSIAAVSEVTLTRDGGAETMTVGSFSALPDGGTAQLQDAVSEGVESQDVSVGGTLTVAQNQAQGLYSGSVTLTVEYN